MVSEAVIVALIGAISTVIGVILTNRSMLEKQAIQMDKQLAVHEARTNERLDELTREVREHNDFAKKVPVIQEQVNTIIRRVDSLETYHRPSA